MNIARSYISYAFVLLTIANLTACSKKTETSATPEVDQRRSCLPNRNAKGA